MGREVRDEPVEKLAKIVSLVPQRMEFLPCFTVSEFLELSGPKRGPSVECLIGDLGDRLLQLLLPEQSLKGQSYSCLMSRPRTLTQKGDPTSSKCLRPVGMRWEYRIS